MDLARRGGRQGKLPASIPGNFQLIKSEECSQSLAVPVRRKQNSFLTRGEFFRDAAKTPIIFGYTHQHNSSTHKYVQVSLQRFPSTPCQIQYMLPDPQVRPELADRLNTVKKKKLSRIGEQQRRHLEYVNRTTDY